MSTVTVEEFKQELRGLTEGRTVVIDNKNREWWVERFHNGFFYLLEDEEVPVKVIIGKRTFVYSGGIDRSRIISIMRVYYPSEKAIRSRAKKSRLENTL